MTTRVRGLDEADPFAALPAAPSPERLLESADLLGQWRRAVRQTLAAGHLVDVAFELSVRRGWPLSIVEALGAPIDLLGCFPGWRRGSRTPFVPGSSGLRLAPSGAGVPLGTLRLQLSPTAGSIPYALRLLRDLLRTLDRTARFVVVVEPGADLEALARLTDRLHAGARLRVRFVPMRTITVFAQDNARSTRDASGRTVLLVPRAFRATDTRAEDELDPTVAEKAFGVPVRRSRLYWEGGNVVHDATADGSRDLCFIGVDTLAENVVRLGLSNREVIGLFEAEFGMAVAPLGRAAAARFDTVEDRVAESGQASFHIDLDVAILGRFGRLRAPRALIADPARGLDFVRNVLSTRRLVEGHFLPPREIRRHLHAEYEAYAASRHPLLLEYATTLANRGYDVIGVPDLRIDPKMDVFRRVNLDFGFCNVLPGLRRGRPSVHFFRSGIAALDADAARRMQLASVDPVPVSTPDVASALMLLSGGLHCCCGTL
jgi:hypothetical protein